MRKLFRWHRGGLDESLATTVEVGSFLDIDRMITGVNDQGFPAGYFSNVRAKYVGDDSERCGEEWKATYYVVADCQAHESAVLGMCNFSETEM